MRESSGPFNRRGGTQAMLGLAMLNPLALVKKSWQIMSPLTLLVHRMPWGQMQQTRKAWDNHQPISIILSLRWFARKNPMAAPDQMDLVPMSFASCPKTFLPPRVEQALQKARVRLGTVW
jgi:hypothetical protein